MLVSFRIPIDGIKISTNKFYAGMHWAKRKQVKDGILDYAAIFCKPTTPIQSYPVEISYRFLFGSRPLDTLNTALMAKMFEDAFRTLGILKEDDPRYVARSILEVVAVDAKKGAPAARKSGQKGYAPDQDWLEITINPYENKHDN